MATIHVVDDNAAIRTALERLLRACGFEVRTHASAIAFLSQATDEGCAIVDIEMPGMSGLQAQAELAARGARWQIIFISGRYDVVAQSRKAALDAGAVAILYKPAGSGEILEAIGVALARLRGEGDPAAGKATTR